MKRQDPRILVLPALIIILCLYPTRAYAVNPDPLQPHQPVLINGDAGFTPANGVTSGNGTFLNPFIIQGLNITAPSGTAITIANSTAYFIVQNVYLYSSQYGIYLYKTANGQVSNSTISRNQNGIFVLYSNLTLVFNNNFVGNINQAYDTGGYFNYWDNGYEAGGNYWSDYTGVDNCSGFSQSVCSGPDGIGDTAYLIPGTSGSADAYPLMKPYFPDTTPPTWPSDKRLTASHLTPTSLTLTWTNATDDTAVIEYEVFQGTKIIVNITANHHSYNVTRLQPSTTYTFKVEAGDRSDNWSSNGPTLTLRTPSSGLSPLSVDYWIRNWYLVLIALIAIVVFSLIVLRHRRQSESRVPRGVVAGSGRSC